MAKHKSLYSKKAALEYIFAQKYNEENPQDEIPFTRTDVRKAIMATSGQAPDNLNNFVKDLVRQGKSDPRSELAKSKGYRLREGSHSESMGVFFRVSEQTADYDIAIECPPDLEIIKFTVSLPNKVIDMIRADEGGLLSVLSYSNILSDFFRYLSDQGSSSVYTVQIPVKVQPHEIDGLFLLVDDRGQRIPIACEAKSKGSDSIMLNQIIGVTASAIDRVLEKDMDCVIPLGAKILQDGTIFLVSFEQCRKSDKSNLNRLINTSTIKKQSRYLIEPLPTKWVTKARRPNETKQLPLEGFAS